MYKLIADDLEKVLNEAKSMGCNDVAALYMIPGHALTVVKIMRSNTMNMNIVLNVARRLIGVKML